MNLVELEIDGSSKKVFAQYVSGQLWIHFGGRTFKYAPKTKGAKGGLAASAEPGNIKAPMPGKIMKVYFSPGESVEQNAVIIKMEAMKMEYSLKTDVAGTVKEVNCAEGDQVALGHLLAIVE
jgi:biotin carboxyl carrier protein